MKNSTCIIREIESKDYLSVAAVWREALGALEITDESFVETCEKMKSDSRYRIFIAEHEGYVIGFVSTVEALAINLPNGYIKVNALAVLPKFRHCGIGKMLMERVEQLAGEHDNSLIGITSGFQRAEAHAFYEHLGYHKSSFWLSKRV